MGLGFLVGRGTRRENKLNTGLCTALEGIDTRGEEERVGTDHRAPTTWYIALQTPSTVLSAPADVEERVVVDAE